MTVLSNFWFGRIDEGTTARFGGSGNEGNQDTLDGYNEPVLRVSEDVGVACPGREAIYDYVRVGGDGAQGREAAGGIE